MSTSPTTSTKGNYPVVVFTQKLRLLSNAHTLQLRPTDVGTVVKGVMHAQAQDYAECQIRVIDHLPPDLPPAQADPEKLAQVVLNLCTNAVEAMPEGGTMTLSAHATKNQLTLEVNDTGVGIPPGFKVFEPFL